MTVLNALEEGLIKLNLADIKGSPFDNAFEIFERNPADVNLILLGTNGNMTDAIKSNIEWIRERETTPDYSHVISGDWGKSPLRGELLKVPEVLNECFGTTDFSISNTILTNGLLLASSGVSDILKQFNQLNNSDNSFDSVSELINASMSFFNNYTLKYANPSIIFAYGNAEHGHSAWKYLRDYYSVIKDNVSIKIKSTSYKFCSLDINGTEVYVIGSPHPCFHYNRLNTPLIYQGLKEIGAV